ncbi:hypothetical protein [Metabacillus sp. RGM 3146]|uniref:hypothetical protein n=1 Tax=Metabacillus sp. RGM 3146 TaxID=3401092 RepID=UPI003B99A1CF
MSLKNLFSFFAKDDQIAQMQVKISSFEKQLTKLDELKDLLKQNGKQAVEKGTTIEEVHIKVDKFVLEKLEYNIHMGQLGIKELKGKLNIGATYGELFPFQLEDEEEAPEGEKKTPKKEKAPKVNIRSR